MEETAAASRLEIEREFYREFGITIDEALAETRARKQRILDDFEVMLYECEQASKKE